MHTKWKQKAKILERQDSNYDKKLDKVSSKDAE